MVDPNRLKKVLENVTNYPNIPACKCEMLATNNSTYIATLGKAETELALYLKRLNLKGSTIDKLVKLIDDYGDERYTECDVNRDMETENI